MIRRVSILLLMALPLQASQIFHMDLEEVIGLARCVVLAKVEERHVIPMDYMNRFEYSLRVISVIEGDSTLKGNFLAFHTMDIPRSRTLDDGTEVWESPLVFGSGLEGVVEPGDTVIALVDSPVTDSTVVSLVRMEPPESLEAIRLLLEQTPEQPL